MELDHHARLLAKFFGQVIDSAETLHMLIEAFQAIFGLKVDGFVGPVTKRILDLPRYCNVPEYFNAGGSLCRYNNSQWQGEEFPGRKPLVITWHATAYPEPEVADDVFRAFRWAHTQIEKACAVEFDLADAIDGSNANVQTDWGPIDGVRGTLAQSEMSCGDHEHCRQLFDVAEKLSFAMGSPPEFGRTPLAIVALHETCHAMGIPHGAYDGVGIMAPYLQPSLVELDAWTIEELQKRYGPPIDPPADPEADALDVRVATSSGAKYGGPLPRVA